MAGFLGVTDLLTDFLRAAARRPFIWGRDDCAQFVAAWVEARRGANPGAGWCYRSPIGAARILKRRGGMAAHFDGCLTPLGIVRTDAPKRGDIAIVDTEQGEIAGIVLGASIACLRGPGIIVRHRSTAPLVAAWSI